MYEQEERELCKIDYDVTAKRMGDRVTVTQKRIYKTGMSRFGRRHRKVMAIDSVSCVEWSQERFARFLVIGIAFLALCCLSTYFIPGSKTVRLISGLVVMAVGVAVTIACAVLYARCKIRTITVYASGGKMRIAAPGISDEDAEEFVFRVLQAAEAARNRKYEEEADHMQGSPV